MKYKNFILKEKTQLNLSLKAFPEKGERLTPRYTGREHTARASQLSSTTKSGKKMIYLFYRQTK